MGTKSFIKKALVSLVEKSGTERLRDKVWARRGTLPAAILVFHRVTDDIPQDPITLGVEQFKAIIKALSEHYRPVPLTKLVEHLERKTAWQPRTVVVTFDDAYRDNHDFAAPILRSYGIPATFFVTVDLVGTDRVLPWEEHLRGRVSWMDWNQVRSLHGAGFEIGSHTLTHCDLGKARGAIARREIFDSKQKLEDALGAAAPLFAYPFGGRENITADNRELIREAGYQCCCSAFGGFVGANSDLFDLPRVGVNNWFGTLPDLHFELRILAPWRWRNPY